MNITTIIAVSFCLIGLVILFFMKKKGNTLAEKRDKKTYEETKTANDLINVQDIRGSFLYTKDGFVVTYLKIEPIAVDLLSRREKRQLTRTLTAELSAEQKPYKFIAVSRPVDISPFVTNYGQIIADTPDPVVKDLLRNEIIEISNLAQSGDVVERQFYFMLWEKWEEGVEEILMKRGLDFKNKFSMGRISCKIIKQQEVVRLGNLVCNPTYAHIEAMDFDANIPIIMDLYGGDEERIKNEKP